MGELHLEIIEHRLRDEFKVDARVGKPRVTYREAITQTQRGEGSVDRTIGGKDVYAKVEVGSKVDQARHGEEDSP
mgnify:CR=1 FL=1